jgi:CYTH domain-containing protein
MACEIERKYLVSDKSFLELAEYSRKLKQGYMTDVNADGTVFRIRIADDKAFLTVKGKQKGISRAEFEYPVPVEDARVMLETLCGTRVIEKTRYYLHYGNFLWEVDVFEGRHQGLIVAEIELESEDVEFPLPPFAAKEVTNDFRYSNFSLSMYEKPV